MIWGFSTCPWDQCHLAPPVGEITPWIAPLARTPVLLSGFLLLLALVGAVLASCALLEPQGVRPVAASLPPVRYVEITTATGKVVSLRRHGSHGG